MYVQCDFRVTVCQCLRPGIKHASGLSGSGNQFLVEVLINQIVLTSVFPSISTCACVLLTLQVPIRDSAGLNPDCGELTKLPGLIIASHLSQHTLMINNFNELTKVKKKKRGNGHRSYDWSMA